MKLPKGARNINPVKRSLGSWVEMIFDAELIHRGILWLRVKDGFGGRGDREDWVAELSVSVSVSDYHFVKEKYWGFKEHQSSTIFGAMDIQIMHAKNTSEYSRKEKQDELKRLSETIERLDLAVSDITRNKR